MHRLQVFSLGKDFTNGELPTDVGHVTVVAHIEFGRFKRRAKNESGIGKLRATAVQPAAFSGVDDGFQAVACASKIRRIVSQSVDVIAYLDALHAYQMQMFDHFEPALEQLNADAKGLQPKIGRLHQHHQI